MLIETGKGVEYGAFASIRVSCKGNGAGRGLFLGILELRSLLESGVVDNTATSTARGTREFDHRKGYFKIVRQMSSIEMKEAC